MIESQAYIAPLVELNSEKLIWMSRAIDTRDKRLFYLLATRNDSPENWGERSRKVGPGKIVTREPTFQAETSVPGDTESSVPYLEAQKRATVVALSELLNRDRGIRDSRVAVVGQVMEVVPYARFDSADRTQSGFRGHGCAVLDVERNPDGLESVVHDRPLLATKLDFLIARYELIQPLFDGGLLDHGSRRFGLGSLCENFGRGDFGDGVR